MFLRRSMCMEIFFSSQDDEECDEETEDGEDAGVPREVYMCEVLYEMCQ